MGNRTLRSFLFFEKKLARRQRATERAKKRTEKKSHLFIFFFSLSLLYNNKNFPPATGEKEFDKVIKANDFVVAEFYGTN